MDSQIGALAGAAYVFDAVNGQQLFKLLASDGETGSRFGAVVGMSGTTAVIGALRGVFNGMASGSVYLFDTRTGAQIA